MTGYLSTKEAAKRLGLKTSSGVVKLIEAGKFDGVVKFGGSWAIPEEEVERLEGIPQRRGRRWPKKDK